MNGRKAKKIHRAVYGDASPRSRMHQPESPLSKTIVADAMRHAYQLTKRLFTMSRG